ncbi:hypothetical protein M422DRAFT_40652 [Sphaerobolus stellatus SS14]|nr:hypothetical protein M422DRAFT_40652 [Sphaerobolus stellatus SS14]
MKQKITPFSSLLYRKCRLNLPSVLTVLEEPATKYLCFPRNTTGKIEKIAGIDVYVAIPSGEYEKDKALLYISGRYKIAETPGIRCIGPSFGNAQLLRMTSLLMAYRCVLKYQRLGTLISTTYIIDLFNGDSVPVAVLDHPEGYKSFDIVRWLGKHDESATRPQLVPVIAALKERSITQFGATGYCFGGKYVVNLGQENVIKVAANSHPSLLKIPYDIELFLAKSNAPILINSCDVDEFFSKEAVESIDILLEDSKYAPRYRHVTWPECVHGFSVKGDLSNPKVKAGKEGALKESVARIKKYLYSTAY